MEPASRRCRTSLRVLSVALAAGTTVLVLCAVVGVERHRGEGNVVALASGLKLLWGRSLFAGARGNRRVHGPPVGSAFSSQDSSIFQGSSWGGVGVERGHRGHWVQRVRHPVQALEETEDTGGEGKEDEDEEEGQLEKGEPSTFLKRMVKEIEEVHRLPKEASLQLEQSEKTVDVAEQQLQLAHTLRLQSKEDTEHAEALEPNVAPLEQVALAREERAKFFEDRAKRAEAEAKDEMESLVQTQRAGPQKVTLQQQMLRGLVDRVAKHANHAGVKKEHSS